MTPTLPKLRKEEGFWARPPTGSRALVTRVTGGAMWVAGASFTPHTVPLNHGAAYDIHPHSVTYCSHIHHRHSVQYTGHAALLHHIRP